MSSWISDFSNTAFILVQCRFSDNVQASQNAHRNNPATDGHHDNNTAPAQFLSATDSIDGFTQQSGAPSPTTSLGFHLPT